MEEGKSSNTASKRGRNLLIHPRFQITLISYALIVAFISIAVFYFSFWGLFEKLHRVGLRAQLGVDDPFFEFVRQQKSWMREIFWTASAAILLMIVALGLWVSHRIAGPLVRLKNFLDSVGVDKKAARLAFRKNDYFADLAESVNTALSTQPEASNNGKAP